MQLRQMKNENNVTIKKDLHLVIPTFPNRRYYYSTFSSNSKKDQAKF